MRKGRSQGSRSRSARCCPCSRWRAGCGDDGGDGGLSGDEKLQVLQARADIAEFCSVQETGTSDLYDRSLGIMLDGVRDLARVYRENPDAKIEIPVEKKSLTMEQVMQEQIAALRKCGRDGRQQAGVLEAALQQQQKLAARRSAFDLLACALARSCLRMLRVARVGAVLLDLLRVQCALLRERRALGLRPLLRAARLRGGRSGGRCCRPRRSASRITV